MSSILIAINKIRESGLTNAAAVLPARRIAETVQVHGNCNAAGTTTPRVAHTVADGTPAPPRLAKFVPRRPSEDSLLTPAIARTWPERR